MLFKTHVLEPDYLPEELPHRESQLAGIASSVKPALCGSSPVNTLCLGPPATGKTSSIRFVLRDLVDSDVITAYVNCLVVSSRQQVFSRIFQAVYGYPPHRSISFPRLYHSILKGLKSPLLVVLDDVNAMEDGVLNEVLFLLLKAHEEMPVKIGVIAAATDVKLTARLDASVGSIFHPYEIYFPPYDREEMRDILFRRAKLAFGGRMSDEAFELVVDEAFAAGDLRYGIYLLKLAGLEASFRRAERIEVDDVELVLGRGRAAFVEKSVTALSDEERVLLELIYSSNSYAATTLYKKLREKVDVGYTKFNEMLYRLERLRLVDFAYEKNRKVVVKRFDEEAVIEALKMQEA